MLTILATIFVFGIIVMIHEFGHFITAKFFGMRVDEFAIGFGPILLKKQGRETLYTIRAIPLGGFNKIHGMTDEEGIDEKSFLAKSVWKRFIVISAGAIMNFILAICIFMGVLLAVGIQIPSNTPIIGGIIESGPAYQIGIKTGDKVVSIDNKPVHEWKDIPLNLVARGEKMTSITLERNGEVINSKILPQITEDKRAVIGVYPEVVSKHVSVLSAIKLSFLNTTRIIENMTLGLVKMIFGKAEANVSGPLGVASMAGQVATLGFVALLNFTALLSINLGVINLLPLPVLDGGYLIMLIFEGISGKKLSTKTLYKIQMVGVAILGSIFIYATYNDIIHLFH